MRSRPFLGALVVPLAFVVCDGATTVKLRVVPSRSSVPGADLDTAVSEAVRDGLSGRPYSCIRGKDPVVMLCESTNGEPVSSRPWVLVEREGGGYLVTVERGRAPAGRRDPEICATARRISEKLERPLRDGVQLVVRADDRCAPDGRPR